MQPEIDLIVLSRDKSPLESRVAEAIARQQGVSLNVIRVIGSPQPADRHRWETIARARNRGKHLAKAPWVMFVDDDVVLGRNCIQSLVTRLRTEPSFGALAADYLQESQRFRTTRHVAMGATLFRRSVLNVIQFRWEVNKCECQCCCDDLRSMLIAIDYLPGAVARHISIDGSPDSTNYRHTTDSAHTPGVVMAAFDRSHFEKFRSRFLKSLRTSGNRERVIALAYGLTPSEERILARLPNVDYVARPANSTAVPIRRLKDFQPIVASLAASTPVAYWDTADVLFQRPLRPLWDLVRAQPEKLLVVGEPFNHPENKAVAGWTLSIRDADARRFAFDAMSKNKFLNSGFSAGTAKTMLAYLQEGHRLRHSKALQGTRDWGDQTALNLYCYTDHNRYHMIDEGWNYCLCGRNRHEYGVNRDGAIIRSGGEKIPVVHGNNKTLEFYWFTR